MLDYDSRLVAEELWAEEWAEIQADTESLRLWEEGQEKEARLQDEIEALIAQGVELPF